MQKRNISLTCAIFGCNALAFSLPEHHCQIHHSHDMDIRIIAPRSFLIGSLDCNLWWGDDNLALALNDGRSYDLRFDMTDWADEHRYATYTDFRVANENDNCRLHAGTYAGTAGDGLWSVKNMQFTTTDRDNDSYGFNCATRFLIGGWFAHCHVAHPNGPYSNTSTVSSYATGVIWSPWHGFYYSLKRIDMKFRATS